MLKCFSQALPFRRLILGLPDKQKSISHTLRRVIRLPLPDQQCPAFLNRLMYGGANNSSTNKASCRSTLDVSLEAYPLFGAVQSPLRKRSHFDHGGLSHLGRSFNFLFSSELGTSYTEKSKFPFYFHYRNSTQKCPIFSDWKKRGKLSLYAVYDRISASGGDL